MDTQCRKCSIGTKRFLLALLFAALTLTARGGERFVREESVPADVLPGNHNLEVTALSEDCESVRMALGASWDDALACRSCAHYLMPWVGEKQGEAALAKANRAIERGIQLYELLKSIDGGIQSLRLARDARGDTNLEEQVGFWRNELALAGRRIVRYASETGVLREDFAIRLQDEAEKRGISAHEIPGKQWANNFRESWRRAGPKTGIRIPLKPHPQSAASWWLENLSLKPGYMATKFRSAGNYFFTPEKAIGAWGFNCKGPRRYEWSGFDERVTLLKKRNCKLLLELPTLHKILTDQERKERVDERLRRGTWIWQRYGAPVPSHLADDPDATLCACGNGDNLKVWGGVQLFNPEIAEAYGDYLQALAKHLKATGFYETIAAVHLERGDWAALPEVVDYGKRTRRRWVNFLQQQYESIQAFNKPTNANYGSFQEVPIPRRKVPEAARPTWQEFKKKHKRQRAHRWGKFLRRKYGSDQKIKEALGKTYRDGHRWQLPLQYPKHVKIDYLNFRRQWIKDYMKIKRKLVAEAFPDKLIIFEQWQFGDHDMIAGRSEKKWGGFYAEDQAQFTSTGPSNERNPFMIRSVGPVGFGSRPSDSIESLYRDYLWINFRNPGNLARYFYDWVAHGYLDHQLAWHSITNHWLTNRRVYRLGPTVANTAPIPQRIGMVLPRHTYDLFSGTIYYSFMGWDWFLQAAKLPYTRIDERFIREGGLAEIELELLILPDVRAMDEKMARCIRQWVQNGGTLIASPMPGKHNPYGRKMRKAWLADVLGVRVDGSVTEKVKDTPLGVTIPRGFFSGGFKKKTDRQPHFQTLKVQTAEVLARYEGGKPAITVNEFGEGKAVTLGYPFGREAVKCDRTSIGFQRTYLLYAREPQIVSRVKWLRSFIVDRLGVKPEFGVDYAEVARWKPDNREAWNPSLSTPKGFDLSPGEYFYITSVGDPRGGAHEMKIEHETPDIALRFFPRYREGLETRYLGISTRDVHYSTYRASINLYLSEHRYRCRINNPKIQAIWDVERNVPVGFYRDKNGVYFDVELPPGYIMMLAVSVSPDIQLFGPDPFPGRTKKEVIDRADELAGGNRPDRVSILTPRRIEPWFKKLGKPVESVREASQKRHPGHRRKVGQKETVLISFGELANRPAARKLADFLRNRYGIAARIVQQAAKIEDFDKPGDRFHVADYAGPVILIGHEWDNNDIALYESMWPWRYGTYQRPYGAHVPFTSSYEWPGSERAVVSMSRRHALINAKGEQVHFRWKRHYKLRKVNPDYPLLRSKLYIAGSGDTALKAVNAIIEVVGE
ncbi:MAG: beta-galactosidase trimerization domain-containing protein [Candidatus Brocadiia bacterium]